MLFFSLVFLILPKYFAHKKHGKTSHDYLLMSKQLALPLFVATLTSTWYGGVFGVTQIAYEHGVYSLFTQGLFWYFSYALFAIFLVKKIRQRKVMSLPELIGQKFGVKARKLAAIMIFFHALPITYAVSIGILLEISLGLNFIYALVLGVVLVTAYTSFGGFRSIVITDCVQFTLMFSSVIMLLLCCYKNYGGNSFLLNNLPPSYFQWQGEHNFFQAIIWLFIACITTFIHPVFYQRCLAAKSDLIAISGIFIAIALWFIFDICTTFGSMYAKALMPQIKSYTAYLQFGVSILPVGLKGIFLSGIIATILSTLDSFLFVSSTSITYDLVNNKKFHSAGVLLCGMFLILVGMLFKGRFESMWLFMEGAFSGSIIVPSMLAIFAQKRFTSHQFILSSCLSLSIFMTTAFLKKAGANTIIEPFYWAILTSSSILFLSDKVFERKTKVTDTTYM